MADTNQQQPTSADADVSAQQPASAKPTMPAVTPPVESKYTREELIAGAGVFGATPHLVAGALHGTKQSEFTLAQATALIETYKTKEV